MDRNKLAFEHFVLAVYKDITNDPLFYAEDRGDEIILMDATAKIQRLEIKVRKYEQIMRSMLDFVQKE